MADDELSLLDKVGIGGILTDVGTGLFSSIFNARNNRKQLEYQKELQAELFRRDDTAVQRRMKDYQDAGLNPLLAVTGGVAGNTSAGAMSYNPIDFGTNISQKVIQQNELKKMKLEQKAMKNAETEQLQDIRKKKLENSILEQQLEQYKNAGYYPTSALGKWTMDANNLIRGIGQSFGFNIHPLQPGIDLKWLLSLLGKNITPETIDEGKKYVKDINDMIEEGQQQVQNMIDEAELNKMARKDRKNEKSFINQNLNSWQNQLYKDFHNENLQLRKIDGYVKIYNKRTKSYYLPNFNSYDGIKAFLKYGNK